LRRRSIQSKTVAPDAGEMEQPAMSECLCVRGLGVFAPAEAFSLSQSPCDLTASFKLTNSALASGPD
jgi:hypothetical protein